MKLSKIKKTPPWTMQNLKNALKDLKYGKTRDAEGFTNDLFKENVAGVDLLFAVLK